MIRASTIAFLALLASSGGVAAGDANRDGNPLELIVWVRGATEAEMRLSPNAAPALRFLAEGGVSIPGATRLERDELVGQLRLAGTALGNKFHRIRSGSGSAAALDELDTLLGNPRPLSEDEKKSLERLRGKKGKSSAKSSDEDSEGLHRNVRDALAAGARFVLIVEKDIAKGSANERSGRDASLESLRKNLSRLPGKGPFGAANRIFLVALFPTRGDPALIITGPLLKKGRVVHENVNALDVASGVRRLLEIDNASAGDGDNAGSFRWIEKARLPEAGAKSRYGQRGAR